MLTAASLTLDILRVINNEVAVPHNGEVHGQLADFHSLVQILEAKDGERWWWWGWGERERRVLMEGLGIFHSEDPL